MAGIVTETKRRLLIGKEIKEVQVPTNTLDTSLYLADLASVGATFNSSRIASELGALPAVVKQNASLALIADTYKTGVVYAINGDTKSLEELNFERGSSATYEDASGNIVLASANVPRINYRNGVLQGWLVEPASTNLLLDSGVANGLGSFNPKGGVLTAVDTGFGLGDLLSKGVTISRNDSGDSYVYKSVTTNAGVKYTFSFYVKMSDGSAPTDSDFSILLFWSGYTLSNSVVSLISNGVYRVSKSIVHASGGGSVVGLIKKAVHSSKSFTVTGFQFEEGSVATSYIPTTTAIATRLADKISTKRPTVVFAKNSLYGKLSDGAGVWFGDGVPSPNTPPAWFKALSGGHFELSSDEPVNIKQLALISRAMTEEEVG